MMSRCRCFAASFLLLCGLAGCGVVGGAAERLEGRVVQGPVAGATVYLDRIDSGTGYLLDQSEYAYSTMTDDKGYWNLPAPPANYGKYRIVSFRGSFSSVDSSGNTVAVPAMQMSAPAGAKTVTALTTLVDLNPELRAKIEATGISRYDLDLSTPVATPAALLLSKSVETLVGTLSDAVDPNQTLSDNELAKVQHTILAAIADNLLDPAVLLANPVVLQAGLVDAAQSAIHIIIADNTEITLSVALAPSTVAAIANTLAAVAAPFTMTNGLVSVSPTDLQSETTLFTVQELQTIATSGTPAVQEFNVTPTPTTVVYPSAKVSDLALNGPITIVFSRSIDPETLTSTSFKVKLGASFIAGGLSYSDATHTATFTPLAPFGYSKTYTVVLAGVTDALGNPVSSAAIPSFTTVAPLLVNSITGSDGFTGANF